LLWEEKILGIPQNCNFKAGDYRQLCAFQSTKFLSFTFMLVCAHVCLGTVYAQSNARTEIAWNKM